ncbi:PhzF family phenazine biosynthesis protein [Nocardiopsis ansamitocini]|uniref:Phenazine antibiotic biosynthesis-like protein n=1 Tax=Nocardiopsis ansamitocini TaxID=1670832 RepID=A0A9W6PAH8_9ACTN|nr:PhzF family phenazine biosynthesis protein [Nocardiopsis ansamitocini]GLU49973.1 phenazine antibiotic biosynthesis-like protein [Nocardiopsis ansamitocini]
MSDQIEYQLVDMFAERLFAGSPLCVVPCAEGLSGEEMQAIAAKVNATETAFVLPPTTPEATYRVRVFTPERESPGGGHSSVGTAATLERIGAIGPGGTVQESAGGLVGLTVGGGRATLIGHGPTAGTDLEPEPLLAAVGLTGADAAGAAPRSVGYGTGFAFLPVQESAVARARPDYSRLDAEGLPALCVFAWDPLRRTAHARLFAPGFGIPEDPACAPVAMALGAWLVGAGWLPSSADTHEYTVVQGAEVGRPARLDCSVTPGPDHIRQGSVTGNVLPVAEGRICARPPLLPRP